MTVGYAGAVAAVVKVALPPLGRDTPYGLVSVWCPSDTGACGAPCATGAWRAVYAIVRCVFLRLEEIDLLHIRRGPASTMALVLGL